MSGLEIRKMTNSTAKSHTAPRITLGAAIRGVWEVHPQAIDSWSGRIWTSQHGFKKSASLAPKMPHETEYFLGEDWIDAFPKLPVKTAPESYDVAYGHSGMQIETESEDEASPLPVEEKFTIFLDDEGDYVIQANREAQHEFLTAHGSTPNEAVYAMRQTLDLITRARMKANGGNHEHPRD